MNMFTYKTDCSEWASGCDNRTGQSGFGYVGVLALLAILSTLALSFVHQVGVQVSANHSRLQHIQSDYLANSAAGHALWRLLNDPGFEPAPDQYTMHNLAGGRYGYKVRKPDAATMAAIATVGVREDAVTHQSYVPYIIPSNTITTYGRSGDSLPDYRRMVGAGFSNPSDTLVAGSSATYWMDLEGCPLRKEMVMATIDHQHQTTLSVWNGTAWGNRTTLGANGDRNYKCFDIAYESQSGRALAVGRNDATTNTYYNIWDGTDWVHPAAQPAFSISGGAIQTVVMSPCPGNDHILIATISWNNVLELFYWDGAAFTHLAVVESSMESDDFGAVQLAYERQSGDAMITWTARGAVRYRIWNGVTLGPEHTVSQFTDDVFFLRMAPDPNSDRIIIAGADKFYDLTVALWDGDGWVDGREVAINTANHSFPVVDVAWEAAGGDALVAWARWGAPYVRYFSWTKGTAFSAGTVARGPELQQQPWLVKLHPISQSEKIVLLAMTDNEVLGYSLWTGDQFKGDPSVILASNISVQNDRAFDLAEAQVPITGGTGTGIAGANQAPIVNAGPDQILVWPTYHIQLDGSVNDDGRPDPPAAVTSQWTRVSGPGQMGFGDAGDPGTMAKIEAEGTHVFRLTASDGELSAFDEVTISVITPQILMTYGSDSLYIDMKGGITAVTPQSSPKYRQFDGSTWSANALVTDIDPLITYWMELEPAVTRKEILMGAMQSDDSIQLSVWDGTTWKAQLEFAPDADRDAKCYDIAYESQSGDALVVGRRGTASTLWYTLWDGSAWSHDPPVAAFDIHGGEVDVVVATANPLSDEILIAVIDGAKELRLYQWDGDGFNPLGLLTDNANTKLDGAVDIVYEQQSGHALIIYSQGMSSAAQYRIWDGTILSTAQALPDFGEFAKIITASADPTSDALFAAALDARNDINVAVWDGNGWTDHQEIETAAESATWRCFDVAWLPSGNGVLVGWGGNGRDTLSYLYWPKNTPLNENAVQAGPIFHDAIRLVRLLPVKAYGSILIVGVNAVNGAYYTQWNAGTGFAPESSGFLATLQNNNAPLFDLAEAGIASGGSGSLTDTAPPVPSPMMWATPPAAVDSTSIIMTATSATDASGVEYYFECTTAGCNDSGWQSAVTYTDGGLAPGTNYTYRVKARDKSDNHNETAWSAEMSATTPSNTMYVGNIGMGYRVSGKKYYGQATVRIQSAGSDVIAGAVVSGSWSGAVSGTSMGTTDNNGEVLLEAPSTSSGRSVTFTVTGVIKTGYTYAPGMNVETSDSITMP